MKIMHALKPVLWIIASALAIGCGHGSITVHKPDGTTVEVTQPPKSIAPATLAWEIGRAHV